MPDFSNLSGISSAAYTDYAAKTQYSNEVQKAVSKAPTSETEKELMDACKQFEAYFLEQIFKEMQKSVDALKPESEDKSTETLVDFFKDQTLQEVSATAVDRQSNGFAQMLYENLKRNYDIPQAPESIEPKDNV